MISRRPQSRSDGGLLEALTNGKPSQVAYEGLWLASQLWIKDGGVLPMQRYLGLLGTCASLTKTARDIWLRKAAKGMEPGTEFAHAHELAAELEKFITRGPWRTWRESGQPPSDASELRSALFYVAKFSDGELISAQTIYRALS